ncbi:MAG: helix-turn-helix transcriptional regulator [Clostridia bacterium]|nr:helix-turn-helix transcriptional regulator [Clostridia bacterium]
MGKASVKKNKSIYQTTRERLELSREAASELMVGITPERLERLENGKQPILPEDVLAMAKAYNAPILCNRYCAEDCPIGRKTVRAIEPKELAQLVLETLDSLNSLGDSSGRLISISADSLIKENELAAFVEIQAELERIAFAAEGLRLWVEQGLAEGRIDPLRYAELRKRLSQT